MEKIFEMDDLGVMKYFIVMEVLHSRDYIFICLQKYILDIQNRFKMQDWKLVTTPVSTGLKLGKDDDFKKGNDNIVNLNVIGYSNSDWGGGLMIPETRMDIFSIWGQNVLVGALAKKITTAQSTVEAEYIVATFAMNQAILLRKMIKDIVHEQTEDTKIMCDNNCSDLI
ncbi:uncharacterized protein [Solanum lycopersicum]|uniref:uncharacterized protein n=1 Tax=Solanum lycopersicum TaxID=4081 RepID=UPI003749D1EB